MPKSRYRHHLFICQGKACSKKGDSDATKKYFKERIKELGLKEEVRACTSSCLDLCDFGPNIVVYPEGVWYSNVQPEDWNEIFEEHVIKDRPVERLRSPAKTPK